MEFLRESRVARQLEDPPTVRTLIMRGPDPLHRHDAQAHRLGHGPRGLVRRLVRRPGLRQADHLGHLAGRNPCFALGPGRIAQRPSTPSAMNRSCHRQTVVLTLPARAMLACVPRPSAVIGMISIRQTCFWDALPSRVISSCRSRSASDTVMDIPVRIMQTRTSRVLRNPKSDSSVSVRPPGLRYQAGLAGVQRKEVPTLGRSALRACKRC